MNTEELIEQLKLAKDPKGKVYLTFENEKRYVVERVIPFASGLNHETGNLDDLVVITLKEG